MNSKEFSLKIEGIVKEKKISHMDAVVWYCEENDLDTSQVSSLISKSLKEKIKLGNYLKRTYSYIICFRSHYILKKNLINKAKLI